MAGNSQQQRVHPSQMGPGGRCPLRQSAGTLGPGTGRAPAPRAPFDRLSPEQQQLVWRLLEHVADRAEEYSLRYWWTNDQARGSVLAGLGTGFDASFSPVDILGGSL